MASALHIPISVRAASGQRYDVVNDWSIRLLRPTLSLICLPAAKTAAPTIALKDSIVVDLLHASAPSGGASRAGSHPIIRSLAALG
jgi:hypothetical protein